VIVYHQGKIAAIKMGLILNYAENEDKIYIKIRL
jgi:hypothetical protein